MRKIERSLLCSNSSPRSVPESFTLKAARTGAFPLALGVLLVAAVVGFTPRAEARNADDSAAVAAYKSNCVVCHGADGTGTPTGKSLKAPDLHADVVQKMTEQQIIDQISNGKNNMPPFKNTLTKDQITALAAYVHSAFGKKK